MKNRHISFGEVERSYCFGLLRRWEPLRLDWNRCRSHFLIKAEWYSDWFGVSKKIVESVLEQGGRILIIDRRSIDPEWPEKSDSMDIGAMEFGGRRVHMISNLEDQDFIERFLDARGAFDEKKRLAYIPPDVALLSDLSGHPSINHYVCGAVGKRLGCPPSEAENTGDVAAPVSWDKAVPVLILTIGSSWCDRSPFLAAALRALSVASFHVITSREVVNPVVHANSTGFLVLAAVAAIDGVRAEGMIQVSERDPKDRYTSRRVLTLFRMPP